MINTVMNTVNAIPTEFGWAMVGFFGCLAMVGTVIVGIEVYRAIKDRIEENKEEA